jgi:hypothetical protein
VSTVKKLVRAAVGRPHTFGWLRRSEDDRIVSGSYFEAWERPDGGMLIIPRQEYDRPVERIVALRRGDFMLVISPKGTAQASARSRSRAGCDGS